MRTLNSGAWARATRGAANAAAPTASTASRRAARARNGLRGLRSVRVTGVTSLPSLVRGHFARRLVGHVDERVVARHGDRNVQGVGVEIGLDVDALHVVA